MDSKYLNEARRYAKKLAVPLVAGLNDTAFSIVSKRYAGSEIVKDADVKREKINGGRMNPIVGYLREEGICVGDRINELVVGPDLIQGSLSKLLGLFPRASGYLASAMPECAHDVAVDYRIEDLEKQHGRTLRAVEADAYDAFASIEERLIERTVRAEKQVSLARLGLERRDRELITLRNEAIPTLLGVLEKNRVLRGMNAVYFDEGHRLTYTTPGFLENLHVDERDLMLSGIPDLTRRLSSGELRKHEHMELTIDDERHTMDIIPIRYSPHGNFTGTLVLIDNVDKRLRDKFRITKKMIARMNLLHSVFRDMSSIPESETT